MRHGQHDRRAGELAGARRREQTDGTTRFRVTGPGVDLVTSCAVPGSYNVANVVLALAMLHENAVPAEVAAPAIAVATVPGRMERIDARPGLPRRRRLQPQAGGRRRCLAGAAPGHRAAG